MRRLIKALIIILFSLTVVASVFAVDKVYTKEETIKKDSYTYDKKSNQLINGIVKINHKSGELKGEIPLKEGLAHGVARYYDTSGTLLEERIYNEGERHGVSRAFDDDGSTISEKTFKNNRLISGFWYSKSGEKTKISSTMIQDYNSSLPNPLEAKEAEAVRKINAAIKSSKKPEYDSNLTNKERFKKSIEVFSKAFEKAGYNYFDTIKKVSNDLQNHRDRIPNKGESRHKLIIMLMAVQKSECQYQKVDCLQLYPPDTRESVQWLWNNSGWSM